MLKLYRIIHGYGDPKMFRCSRDEQHQTRCVAAIRKRRRTEEADRAAASVEPDTSETLTAISVGP